MNIGVVYVIGGEKFASWALKSIISLRHNAGNSSNIPIFVHFMGRVLFEKQFNSLSCHIIQHECEVSQSSHRKIRSLVMKENTLDKYVMIDADTFVQGDFSEFFQLIPQDGIAGVEDGNFKSHLQMAEFMFVTKHANKKDIRNIVKNFLSIDYGTEEKFPPYYNCGVLGLSQKASRALGEDLCPLLDRLCTHKEYNQRDDQLPINAVLHKNNIQGILINPIYNYTRSRMRNNIKLGTHDSVKNDIRIIHNRHYSKEADWANVREIFEKYDQLRYSK